MASTGLDIWATDVKRRGKYKFGKQQIQFYKPSKGYPSEEKAAAKPKQKLELEHVYGYSGGNRQCLIAKQGKLVYFLAAAGIVYDVESNSQQFFLEHNDDVTCICGDPREGSTLVATGQKDPKDIPGAGKDLPKIYIWDMMTCEALTLIDRVCVSFVRGLRWSPATGYLYVLCGDDGQSLKVYDTSKLKPGGKAGKACQQVLLDQPTTRQKIQGFAINPKPKNGLDELVFFCSGKVLTGYVSEGKGKTKLQLSKLSAISIKTKEKAFLDCVFFPSGRFVVGGASGGMYFCEGSKLDREVKGSHKKALKAFALNDSGNTLYSAGMDGVLKSWDSRGKVKWTSEEVEIKESDFRFTPQTLQCDETTNSLYIGTKTNQIARFELKGNEASVVIDGHDGQVWGLATHPKKPFFVTGGWDRAVKVWNPETWTCVRTHEFPKAKKDKGKKEKKGGDEKKDDMEPERWRITQCATSPNGNWIAVGTADSSLAILNYPKLNLFAHHRIPKANAKNELEGIEYLRFSPNGKMIAAAHGDGNVYIFTMVVGKDGDKKKVTLKRWKPLKHRAAPSHLQWGSDNNVLKSLTRDYEVVHWVLEAKKKVAKMYAKVPDPDKYKFAGDPLIAGWDVQGLYQDGWDGTDMNDASLTKDGKLVATGDDFGTVRIHRFPAIDKEAHFAYPGHAEHVVGVEFLRDDKTLLSCGGADMAIFQWKVIG